MNKKRFIVCVLALLVISISAPAQACTIFMAETENSVLTGNNEDWLYSFSTSMKIIAPDGNNYGRICFYLETYMQGGMNEHGLFYDGAACPKTELPPYDDSKGEMDHQFGDIALSKCSNVAEVVELFETYNFPDFYHQLLFVDASGESAVLTWVDGEFRVIYREDKSYQLISNFYLTNPSLGGYPCRRFSTAEKLLEENTSSISLFREILDATKQSWGSGGTLYSNIHDLTNKDVYIFQRGRMDAAHKINLTQQLVAMEEGQIEAYSIEDLTFDTLVTDTDINTDIVEEAQPTDKLEPEAVETSGAEAATGDQESVPIFTEESEQKSNMDWIVYLIMVMAAAIIVLLLFVIYKRKKT